MSPTNPRASDLFRFSFLRICSTIMLVGPKPMKANMPLTSATFRS